MSSDQPTANQSSCHGSGSRLSGVGHPHHWIMLLCALGFIALFLFNRSWLSNWSWLLILACPLAMLFMMRHNHGSNKDNPS
ncbi:MAG: DUF2933 domain-containing protein [Candidatus Kerfeldbacteria bacterium]|nr:DUF2933 domain-containing protein [Candidatus Kerfeldbacteria bacterium]